MTRGAGREGAGTPSHPCHQEEQRRLSSYTISGHGALHEHGDLRENGEGDSLGVADLRCPRALAPTVVPSADPVQAERCALALKQHESESSVWRVRVHTSRYASVDPLWRAYSSA